MNLKELEDKIQETFGWMKEVVISNDSLFPSFHFKKKDGEETIKAITCFVGTDPSELKEGFDTITGYCFKEEKFEPYRKGIKRYDIMVSIPGIAGSIVYIQGLEAKKNIKKETRKVEISYKEKFCNVNINFVDETMNRDTLKYDELYWPVICLVAHEFIHAISIGFAETNYMKDEAYTNYYAKKLIHLVLLKHNILVTDSFFDSYEINGTQEYLNEKRRIVYAEKELYFNGKQRISAVHQTDCATKIG